MSQPTEDIVNYRLAKKHFERKQKIVVLKNSYQYRNRRRITVKRFMLGLLVGVVAVAVLYFLYGMKYRSAFLPNTIIDGVDASGETIEEFQQHMADEISKYILVHHRINNRVKLYCQWYTLISPFKRICRNIILFDETQDTFFQLLHRLIVFSF